MRLVLWELIFMLVILKLPVVYLCAVVVWAIRAEPSPSEGAAPPDDSPGEPWRPHDPRRLRGRRNGPHGGGPTRRYARRTASHRSRVDR